MTSQEAFLAYRTAVRAAIILMDAYREAAADRKTDEVIRLLKQRDAAVAKRDEAERTMNLAIVAELRAEKKTEDAGG